jgi:valyl-tRNA synthetase
VLVSFGRASELTVGTALAKPDGSVADVVRGVEVFLVVAGKVDFEKERQRLTKELERLRGQIVGIEKKLGNAGFVSGAKPEVVEGERRKLADWTATAEKLARNLESLQ